MNILAFAGSLRKDSYNKKLLAEAVRLLNEKGGHRITSIDLKGLNIPIYDGDVETESGIPSGIKTLGELMNEANAFIIASPEYNGGIASPLKNTLDWLSRMKPKPYAGKQLLLMAASTGGFAGVRGLWHTRVPFEAEGVHVFPEMMGLGAANDAFTQEGRLKEEKQYTRLKNLLDKFVTYSESV